MASLQMSKLSFIQAWFGRQKNDGERNISINLKEGKLKITIDDQECIWAEDVQTKDETLDQAILRALARI